MRIVDGIETFLPVTVARGMSEEVVLLRAEETLREIGATLPVGYRLAVSRGEPPVAGAIRVGSARSRLGSAPDYRIWAVPAEGWDAGAPRATPERIRALRGEAAIAGDLEMVAVCDRALQGDGAAIAECERVFRGVEAQLG